jgi:AcrR family transcriptional regulator
LHFIIDCSITGRMSRATSIRQTAEARREQVLDAATHEFATHGYHAASTAAIAREAGISQPYIYALFPNKRELFLAAHARMIDRLRGAFLAAARDGADPEERLMRMGLAYRPLVAANHDDLLLQLQGHAAAGDAEIGPEVAGAFKSLFEDVRRASGAGEEEVARFFACGMLINVVTALGLPELAAPALDWTEAAA